MKNMTAETVFARMEQAIERIHTKALTCDWQNREFYVNWLAQSFNYVKWTTRQLALASSRTAPGSEDHLHWRFIEEAKEEKRHEALIEHDLKSLGHSVEEFPETPHTSFFYQTLTYMIEREHPMSILGYALTLEGYAATKVADLYQQLKKAHGDKATTFVRVHCEVDQDHFANALPYLKACPPEHLPYIMRSIELCESIYCGILGDVQEAVGSRPRPQQRAG